jgi:uncharacterized membrane protein YjjP (DUF1212 family)
VLDAHTVATQAAVTVKTPQGEHYTSTQMILPEKTGTDLNRLETINSAARHICDTTPPIERLPLSLNRSAAQWSWLVFLGYLLGTGPFAIFFGGSLLDGIAASLIGGIIYIMELIRSRHHQNRTIYTVIACFLSGLLARFSVGLGLGVDLEMVMIGDVMLFIPGLALVNGVRELFYSDILTGIYRMIEAVLGAGAIAVGYALALMIGGGAV